MQLDAVRPEPVLCFCCNALGSRHQQQQAAVLSQGLKVSLALLK